jgi:hypothetical protein
MDHKLRLSVMAGLVAYVIVTQLHKINRLSVYMHGISTLKYAESRALNNSIASMNITPSVQSFTALEWVDIVTNATHAAGRHQYMLLQGR